MHDIRSTNSDDGFAMEIIKDLLAEGLSGGELHSKFAHQHDDIKKAIGLLIDEADEIVTGQRKSAATEDIFGKK